MIFFSFTREAGVKSEENHLTHTLEVSKEFLPEHHLIYLPVFMFVSFYFTFIQGQVYLYNKIYRVLNISIK